MAKKEIKKEDDKQTLINKAINERIEKYNKRKVSDNK